MFDRKCLAAAAWILVVLLQACSARPQNGAVAAGVRYPEIAAGKANDRPNTVITGPDVARQDNLVDLLTPVPEGFRDLGGAVFRDGTLMVITVNNSPEGPNDLLLSMVHGIAIRGSYDRAVPMAAEFCSGSGADLEHPIRLSGEAASTYPVRTAIGCALALHPGAKWWSSRLIARHGMSTAIITVKDPQGSPYQAFVDLSPYLDAMTPR
jgi:hypothetical protein